MITYKTSIGEMFSMCVSFLVIVICSIMWFLIECIFFYRAGGHTKKLVLGVSNTLGPP